MVYSAPSFLPTGNMKIGLGTRLFAAVLAMAAMAVLLLRQNVWPVPVTARSQSPVAPALEDCCRSGCSPCVFDLYEDALARYQAALAAWEAAHG